MGGAAFVMDGQPLATCTCASEQCSDFDVLHAHAGIKDLPESPTKALLDDEVFLRAFHHALLEVRPAISAPTAATC